MTRLVIAAAMCMSLAPMSVSAQGNGTARPGDQAPTTITGTATAPESGRGVMGPSKMSKRCSADAMMDPSHAMENGLPAEHFAEGEVRKVDEAAGKLTLRHAGMACLDMPPMTMVFRVRNPAWLQDLRVGDIVLFRANRVDGNLAVTALERTSRGSP